MTVTILQRIKVFLSLKASILLQNLAMNSFGFASSDSGGAKMSENLLKVQVYFKSLNVQNVEEAPTYQVKAKQQF
jgi:hypothetical protein